MKADHYIQKIDDVLDGLFTDPDVSDNQLVEALQDLRNTVQTGIRTATNIKAGVR